MISDSFADFLTCLRNGSRANLRFVDVCGSKLIISVLKLFVSEGWIHHFICKYDEGKLKIRVFLKYDENRAPLISEITRISKPGRRVYIQNSRIYKHKNGMGLLVISTSKGIMSGYRAKVEHLGGELLCSLSY